jgi:hypothetical protein
MRKGKKKSFAFQFAISFKISLAITLTLTLTISFSVAWVGSACAHAYIVESRTFPLQAQRATENEAEATNERGTIEETTTQAIEVEDEKERWTVRDSSFHSCFLGCQVPSAHCADGSSSAYRTAGLGAVDQGLTAWRNIPADVTRFR